MTTDARRAVVTGVLEQLIQALRDLSDEDFEKLMEWRAGSVGFVRETGSPKAEPAEGGSACCVQGV